MKGMTRSISARRLLQGWMPLLAVAALGLATAGPAAAVTLVFDGPTNAGLVPPDEVVALGVSEASATGSGLTILSIPDGDLPPLETIESLELGVSNLLDQSSVSPSMPISGQPASASSSWSVANQSADDLIGDLYLVIITELPFMGQTATGDPFTVDYDPADVGLDLRPEEGWVIVNSFSTSLGIDLFFPAISLGSVLAGDSALFLMHYELAAAQTALVDGGIELQLPKLQVMGTFLPIPEPSTALLVATGLGGLVWLGRRRP